MRKLACSSAAIAALLLPNIAPAQVTSGAAHVGNASNIAANHVLTGDCSLSNAGVVTCTRSNGTAFGNAAFRTVSNSGAGDLCALQLNCLWTAQHVFNLQTFTGVASPKNNTIIQLVDQPANPATDGEVNAVDAFAYQGYIQFAGERYDENTVTGGFQAVGADEPVAFFVAAPFDGASDAETANIGAYTTEAQSSLPAHHGTAIVLSATKNATSTYRNVSMCWNAGGSGGVTVGDYGGSFPAICGTDPGAGSLATQKDVIAGSHFVTSGGQGALSSCGTGAVIDRGTDQAGEITTGGSVTSCTYAYAKTWKSPASCIVQVFDHATPTAYVTSLTTTSFTVAFSAAYSGAFTYICMGI